jgi:hypothetical protein
MASKGSYGFKRAGYRGLCVVCKAPFIGKGDRCQYHRDELVIRRRRKPR